MVSTAVVANVNLSSRVPGLQDLWEITLGMDEILVAILDGECDYSHPNLIEADITSANVLGINCSGSGTAAQHGTHVTSVILGQDNENLKGIAPKCRGLSIPIFSNSLEGALIPCSQIDLARAILYAADRGSQVINISAGQLTPDGETDCLLTNAIRHCLDQNILIVSAAGNNGCDCLHIPGAIPSVLAVGAMNEAGLPLNFSNWGEQYQAQGVLAIGENIIGAVPGGKTAVQTGTSYATAVVSGVAALLLSVQAKQGQTPDPKGVRDAILQSALTCDNQPINDCSRLLTGRLNIKGALSIICSSGAAMNKASKQLTDPSAIAKTTIAKPTAPTLPIEQELLTVQAASYTTTPTAPVIQSSYGQSMTPGDTRGIEPAACSCEEGGTVSMQLVYALGSLGYDFGTQARQDSIQQHMNEETSLHNPRQLIAYLEENPWDAADIIWTLNLDATTLYAVMPQGPYAERGYAQLVQYLREQIEEGIERISIPGVIVGQMMLMSGQTVPVIVPTLRCMYSWTTAALVEAVSGSNPDQTAVQGIANFLKRVYYELRNLGITSQERAINYAATNAFNIEGIFASVIQDEMELDLIEVEPSPLCRPGADCWDVKLTFFNPRRVFEQARKVYRFTVDVSDVCPVSVGSVRSWFVK